MMTCTAERGMRGVGVEGETMNRERMAEKLMILKDRKN